ncbi:hypothetical protein GCM10027447_00700 [Glycomyces halotolerans]
MDAARASIPYTAVWLFEYGWEYEDDGLIADALLEEARERARAEGTTLRALIEEGPVLTRPGAGKSGYTLPDRSFGSGGLQPHLESASWEAIRAFANEDGI